MPDARELLIVNALEDALSQPTAQTVSRPAGLKVHRMRQRPALQDDLPSAVLFLLGHEGDPVEDATGILLQRLLIGIETRILLQAGIPADDQLSEVMTWIYLAVMADESLGGLAQMIFPKEMGEHVLEEAELPLAKGAQVFRIQYQHARNDPRSSS